MHARLSTITCSSLSLILLLPLLGCPEKDPIEEAMEAMELAIDSEAILIGDEEPEPEPKPRTGSGATGGEGASAPSPSTAPEMAGGSTISQDDVVAVVNRKKGLVRSCYEKELKSNPYLGGVVSVGWTVTSGGGVQNVRILGNSTGNRDMESCITGTIRDWAFPASQASVDIEYPFRFTPGL
jgi:TonB family protein